MVGVSFYSGKCAACEHDAAEEITAALEAGAKPLGLQWAYQDEGLVYRDFRQHLDQCLADRETTERGAA